MDPSALEARLARLSPAASRAAAYVACAGVAAPILYHLARGSPAYLGLFEDDFFYYAIIADELVKTGALTFDGVTSTNGFHPLWFAVILLLRTACGGLGTAFFAAVALAMLAATIASFESSRLLARALGAPPAVAAPIAALMAFTTSKILASGMEIALAVPLFTWLLVLVARGDEVTPRRTAKLGLVASLAVLARLDLAIFVAMLLAGWLVLARPRAGTALRALGAFAAGGSALAAYAVFNVARFGALLPTSAVAKNLRTAGGFNLAFVRLGLFDTVFGVRIVLLVPLGALALALLVRRDPRAKRAARFAGGLALLFPAVFYVTTASRSDWCFFSWYAYPFAPALVVAMTLIWEWAAPLFSPDLLGGLPRQLTAGVVALLVAATAVSGLRYFTFHGPRWSIADNSLTAMSFELAERVRGLEGTFAMGDKAGIATYLTKKRVVQLEGLVCDRALLEHVRREDPLSAVLEEYGVDYLVVSVGATRPEERDGCYLVVHPNPDQAGERSAKMRARVCAEPIARFSTPHGPNPWSRYLPLETFVFDVRGDRRRAVVSP